MRTQIGGNAPRLVRLLVVASVMSSRGPPSAKGTFSRRMSAASKRPNDCAGGTSTRRLLASADQTACTFETGRVTVRSSSMRCTSYGSVELRLTRRRSTSGKAARRRHPSVPWQH
jgi:hypothetical protein